jgi:hypothetical protein
MMEGTVNKGESETLADFAFLALGCALGAAADWAGMRAAADDLEETGCGAHMATRCLGAAECAPESLPVRAETRLESAMAEEPEEAMA